MSVSMYQIKRWYQMLIGNSVWHVNQDIGKYFRKDIISGYYNNMTEKVIMIPDLLENAEMPKLNLPDGKFTYFPTAIFQYGLGAYDLYLQTKEECYRRKFMQCVSWAMEHQDEKGRWNNFSHYSPEYPYSAMAQGEATSLLLRAYVLSSNKDYLEAAKKSIDYMLLPIEAGGTTKYDSGNAYLMEYTFKGMVLNGSIFAWWGLYDYVLATKDLTHYQDALNKTLNSIIYILPRFNCSYWSMYSLDGLISSPFYHNLHIAQMQAMFMITGNKVFYNYAECWRNQQHNPICKCRAFIRKSIQKILE